MLEAWGKPLLLRRIHCFCIRIREDTITLNLPHQSIAGASNERMLMYLEKYASMKKYNAHY